MCPSQRRQVTRSCSGSGSPIAVGDQELRARPLAAFEGSLGRLQQELNAPLAHRVLVVGLKLPAGTAAAQSAPVADHHLPHPPSG